MSQQKFASNVVEKCLTFSGPAERQILVSEMLGTTDENEPLQVFLTLFIYYVLLINFRFNTTICIFKSTVSEAFDIIPCLRFQIIMNDLVISNPIIA